MKEIVMKVVGAAFALIELAFMVGFGVVLWLEVGPPVALIFWVGVAMVYDMRSSRPSNQQ